MRVLMYGANGWIGTQMCEYLGKSSDATVYVAKSRADDEYNVEKEILDIRPSHIMCFIGRTSGKIGDRIYNTIDYLEQEGKLVDNVRDNLYSPITIAILCKKYNIHMTYMGTGCIFDYDSNHLFGKEENGFTENDKPNFFGSSYSIVKGFTDRLMHMFDDSVLNLRIRMPITSKRNQRNFIDKITKYKKICSIPNSMTVLDDFVPIIADMAKKRLTGTFNTVNPGLISHNEILTMYRDIVDPTFTWENFTIEEQDKILDAKRSNNYLDTEKLLKYYPDVKNIKESMKEILKNYLKQI
jgi:dTDP-4-dehydrorhamnose reductase